MTPRIGRASRFRDLSIRRKLLLVGLASTGLAIVVLSVLLIVRNTVSWRNRATWDLQTYAAIISTNAAPAVVFDDRSAAADTLAALRATPDIVFGGIYDKAGALFASYGATAGQPRLLDAATQAGLSRFTSDALTLAAPIAFNGEHLGTIYLESSLQALYWAMFGDALLILGAAAGAFALAAVLMNGLNKSIVDPLSELSAVMQTVSHEGNYAVRVTPRNADEVGRLARTFNTMLQTVQDRDATLARNEAALEGTVVQRTGELQQSNVRLEQELTDRTTAEEVLREHDALLKSVTRGASTLLGSQNIDGALAGVLELIGQTLGVSRVQLNTVAVTRDGHLRSSFHYEWAPAGVPLLTDGAHSTGFDLTTLFPKVAGRLLVGEHLSVNLDDIPAAERDLFITMGMRSLLVIPVSMQGKLWGTLNFVDATVEKRQWSWAEIDTLKTLADLVGVSLTHAAYVGQLADANAIIQNSPTILYRLRAEPGFPLVYMSPNISKLGYQASTLIASPHWFGDLIHPDDIARLQDAMVRVLESDTAGVIELRLRSGLNEERWVENRYAPVHDAAGRLVEVEGIMADITDRKAAEDKIAQLARTDSLTGLANRSTFADRLHRAFEAHQRGATSLAVLYLDIDRFKEINDTLGHSAGDQLLKAIAGRLVSSIRETDLAARLGGDEFAVLQLDLPDETAAGTLASGTLARTIIDAVGTAYRIEGHDVHATISIGICPASADVDSPDAMLARADAALYRAKEEGRNQYRFHTLELDRLVRERVTLADDLRRAIRLGELELQHQPEVNVVTGATVAMRAVVHWNHPTRGLLPASTFLPVAERTGVMVALGHWVLDEACHRMRLWTDGGMPPPRIAIQLALGQLHRGSDLVNDVKETLAKWGLPATTLQFDASESLLTRASATQAAVLSDLIKLGVHIGLDDFGGDSSTFECLRTYGVAHATISRSFIELAAGDDARADTILAAVAAAKALGIDLVAEGLDTPEQRAVFLSMGTDGGRHPVRFSEPLSDKAAAAFLGTFNDTSVAARL